ncbi:MAG: hypothetical protein K6E42_05395 [Synergistes sp.]|nr:hypothetical protein [Synergistes sp.]
MKKTLTPLISALLLLFVFVSLASAKPEVTEFRKDGFDLSQIKTVLVMPVGYDVDIPASEPFLVESAEQRWEEQTLKKQDHFPYLLKSTKDVVERAAFVSGEPVGHMTQQQLADKAYEVAADQVDAILYCTVTKCSIDVLHHPGEYVTRYRVVDKPVWRNDHWETHRVSVPYQEYKEPWDEDITHGAVKLELYSAKDETLLYGESVDARTGEGLFSGAPSLTKHIQNVIENAAKRIPVK